MNQLTAQYQQSILHNNDTGMSNIVLIYTKDTLRRELGEYLHLFYILPNIH